MSYAKQTLYKKNIKKTVRRKANGNSKRRKNKRK